MRRRPKLVVRLSPNTATGGDGAFDDEHLGLGRLTGNLGGQNQVVPAGVDATASTGVVVRCDRLDVSFGAADLEPTS